jgi:hypothetical protein
VVDITDFWNKSIDDIIEEERKSFENKKIRLLSKKV